VLAGISEGRDVVLDESSVLRFAAAYETHIRLEEEELLPWAGRLLGSDAVLQISHAMTARRRVPTAGTD